MEELKLILEALAGIANGAGTLAGWLIAAHYGVSALKVIVFVVGLCYVVTVGIRVLRGVSDAEKMLRSVANRLGVENFDSWHGPDCAKLVKALDALRTPK